MFPGQCSAQESNTRALPDGSGPCGNNLKQPTLEGRRGPSGSSIVVQEPALAPLANIALLCAATWGGVLKRREQITEEKQ